MVDDLAGAVSSCREEVAAVGDALDELAARTSGEHNSAMQALRVVRDDDARARERLWTLRNSSEYAVAFDEAEPLVTVIITTYNNWQLLRERALPSVLAQTYQHFECIVVGDAARRRQPRRWARSWTIACASSTCRIADPILQPHGMPGWSPERRRLTQPSR